MKKAENMEIQLKTELVLLLLLLLLLRHIHAESNFTWEENQACPTTAAAAAVPASRLC